MLCSIVKLAKKLIKIPSLSPNDLGCQKIIEDYLLQSKFTVESMLFHDTKNLWAWHGHGKTLIFAGHTDVVSVGNIKNWIYPPFEPTINNNLLYGRGAADMKGALASMIIAATRFVKKYPNHDNRIAFLITSDEEGTAKNGTVKVLDTLLKRKETLNYCLVGEPSSNKKIGDVIKNGRRGSLSANLFIYGIQGHVAYSHLANNPIHSTIKSINELIKKKWDKGNKYFSPTTMQIVSIHSGSDSEIISNVIPEVLKIQINFRFNPLISENEIKEKVEKILKKNKLNYKIKWIISGKPFITKKGKLIDYTIETIKRFQGFIPSIETGGGTSDGRFIAKKGIQVVELGPINHTIHKINESVSIFDLQLLSKMYQKIIEKLLL